MLKLPLDLKYYTLAVGQSHRIKEDDLSVRLYTITNRVTHIIEHEDLDLASCYERALGMDRNLERAAQFFALNALTPFKHLADINVAAEGEPDPLEGMLLPPTAGGNGGPLLN